MTAAAGRPGSEPAAGAAVSVPRSGPTNRHAHTWALMQFELANDHPVVRQRCETCGLVRRYRAWERYWSPPTSPSGR